MGATSRTKCLPYKAVDAILLRATPSAVSATTAMRLPPLTSLDAARGWARRGPPGL
ncbi:hypothetical protein [Streptomyces sp. BE230]|uniref:hypothetical protein n=1 Tax=Streptomyces sp. BE230 TaxID=3002526 RepID=UPI002ED06712|nr:hypothetical protein [Streptomyces sp. BE230]